MDRGNSARERNNAREHIRDFEQREYYKDPPTLAFHMKAWKILCKQLRALSKFFKEDATVTFTPSPSIIFQAVKACYVLKVTIASECLYITDKDKFGVKTINNNMALFDSFIHLISNPKITRVYIQDESRLYTKMLLSTSEICTQTSVPAIGDQDIICENGKFCTRIDFDSVAINELSKWLSPPPKTKKANRGNDGVIHILIQSSPGNIKFVADGNELEFLHCARTVFCDAKNQRITVNAKNLQTVLAACSIFKCACSFRIMEGKHPKVYITTRNAYVCIEGFIAEEFSSDIEFYGMFEDNVDGASNIGGIKEECNDEVNCLSPPMSDCENTGNKMHTDGIEADVSFVSENKRKKENSVRKHKDKSKERERVNCISESDDDSNGEEFDPFKYKQRSKKSKI